MTHAAAAMAHLWARNAQVSSGAILSGPQIRMNADFEANRDPTYVPEVSRQVGKTYWALAKADEIARANPGTQLRVGTAFKADIETIVRPNFRNVLATCPDPLRPQYKASLATYQYSNEAEIKLVGLDKNPDQMRGNRLRLVVIEEAGFTDSDVLRYVLDSVVSSAQLREPDARTILPSTPPEEGQEHYWCEIADRCELAGSYTKITIDEAGFPLEAIAKLEKKLGGRESVAFRREALCQRIVDTTKTIIPEWTEKNVGAYERPRYFPFLKKFCFLDSGVEHKTVGILGYYDFPKARLVCEAEFALTGAEVTTRAIHDNFARLEKALSYDNPIRYSDNNNIILLQDLDSDYKMHFIPTSKDTLPAMVNNLRLWVKDQRVVLLPTCQLTARTMKSGLWNKDRTKFKTTVALGHCDALASLMYGVRNVETYAHINPIPPSFGVDTPNTFFTNPDSLTGSAKVIAEAFGIKRRR